MIHNIYLTSNISVYIRDGGWLIAVIMRGVLAATARLSEAAKCSRNRRRRDLFCLIFVFLFYTRTPQEFNSFLIAFGSRLFDTSAQSLPNYILHFLTRLLSVQDDLSASVSKQLLDIDLAVTDKTICSTNLLIILVMMQVSKKIPFDDPQVLMAVRAFYIVSNLIIAGVYLYVQTIINKKKGEL